MEIIRLPTKFKEFLNLLNEKQVEYLLVGGYAVNIHGYNRATGDIDIWIAAVKAILKKWSKFFQDFGFSSLGLQPEAFNHSDRMLTIGTAPLKIKVLTSIDAVRFEKCFAERIEKVIGGVTLNIISFDRLIQNKTATGPDKDLTDAKELQKRQ